MSVSTTDNNRTVTQVGRLLVVAVVVMDMTGWLTLLLVLRLLLLLLMLLSSRHGDTGSLEFSPETGPAKSIMTI